MSESVIEFNGVGKRFGRKQALGDLTFTVERGSVVGLLGRNGAGKTTALRCLLGLQQPTTGTVRIFGRDPWSLDIATKQRVGYLSERGVPFLWSTTDDLIGLCAPRYPRWDRELEEELVVRFKIARREKLSSLSLGQQRAVGLLLALCPHPEVLVLDEPAANLDAVMRREFLEQVLGLVAQRGRTVLFSSHILSDVERVADRILIVHDGTTLVDRSTDACKEEFRRVRLIFDRQAPVALDIPGALRVRRSGREILATVDNFTDELPRALAQATGAEVEVHALGLEELFIDLVGDQEAA